jgi:parallel beta-helix repeat protein
LRVSWFSFIITFLLCVALSTGIRTFGEAIPSCDIVAASSETIQEAINNASPGDTIVVPSGIYFEHVVVNKTISLVGQDRDTTVIDGQSQVAVISIEADGVRISNFTMRHADVEIGPLPASYNGPVNSTVFEDNVVVGGGIDICGSDNVILRNRVSEDHAAEGGICVSRLSPSGFMNNTISENEVLNCTFGLMLFGDCNNVLDNVFSFNEVGFHAAGANNTITNNTISRNNFGMRLLTSDSLFRNNKLSENGHNVFTSVSTGMSPNLADNDVDASNTVDGKPVYFLLDETDLTINSNGFPSVGYLALKNCSNVTIHGLTLTGNGEGLVLSGCSNCRVDGNIIKGNMAGVLADTNSSTFCNNVITENYHGVSLAGYENQFENNTVTNNTIRLSQWRFPDFWPFDEFMREYLDAFFFYYGGVFLFHASNSTIFNNTIAWNEQGILLYSSSFNVLRNNTIEGNVHNFGVEPPLYPYEWNLPGRAPDPPQISPFLVNDVDTSNTVNGRPIYWWINRNDEQVPTDAGYVALINSTGIVVRDLVLQNCTQDILLVSDNDTIVANNTILDARDGIRIWPTPGANSFNNTVTLNTIMRCGVAVDVASANSTFSENVFAYDLVGLNDRGGGYDLIFRNNFTDNVFPPAEEFVLGYWPSHADPIIYYHNGAVGIVLESLNNAVRNNWFENNDYAMSVGLITGRGFSSRIYHNNFGSSTVASFEGLYSPFWNITGVDYPLGGNYWAESSGIDFRSGIAQDDSGSDGIQDNAHLSVRCVDLYPLAGPISIFDAGIWNETADFIEVVSNSTVSGFQLDVNRKTMFFKVAGSGGTGFCRVIISNTIVQDMWNRSYSVLVNSEPCSFTNWTDATHTYVYFQYNHSEHEILIVPESSVLMLLSVFMIATLLAVVVYRKRILSRTMWAR